MKLEYWGRAFY